MNWFVVSLIACSTFAVGVHGLLYESPVSAAVIVGDPITFLCTGNEDNETTHAYVWQHVPRGETQPVLIVYDCQVNPVYANIYSTEVTDNGGCNLIVRGVTPVSAGSYTCQHWFDQASADLIALNSDSNCNFGPTDLVTGELIQIQCYLNYNGTIAPLLEFRSETGFVYTNATINTFATQVNGLVRFPVYPPVTRAATVNTFFPAPITFTYTWTLPSVLVQFPVTNIAIETLSDFECGYYVNFTRLKCTADGFPAPSFTWTDVSSGEVFETDTITLRNPGENEFICTATNVIRDVDNIVGAEISINVTDDEPTTCAPSVTPTEPTTTTKETTTPEPTTTTTEAIPITECGSILRVAPDGTAVVPGYGPICYISRANDSAYLTTACRDLIQRLPPDIGDYTSLLARGGNFGCNILTRSDFIGADNACFDNYQHTITLAAAPTSVSLVVCIKLPRT
jgi:hypothetical protein